MKPPKDNQSLLGEEGVWEFHKFPNGLDEEDYYNHHLKKYRVVKNLVLKYKPKTILDIGIGTGVFYSLFKDLGEYELTGVDIETSYFPLLKKRGINVEKCNIEIETLPFQKEKFDLVICDSIIEHTLDPKRLLSELKRVLKNDGHLILVAPNATSVLRRWSHLRGRNLFWPLIENLFTKTYLARCSVFYSEKEINYAFQQSELKVMERKYIDETSHDRKNISLKVLRTLSRYIETLRDVIVIIGQKSK